jgi:hypothetical protein
MYAVSLWVAKVIHSWKTNIATDLMLQMITFIHNLVTNKTQWLWGNYMVIKVKKSSNGKQCKEH